MVNNIFLGFIGETWKYNIPYACAHLYSNDSNVQIEREEDHYLDALQRILKK